MDIGDWRRKIDELDRRLVELLNERARCAQQIGLLKRDTSLPIYEPDREKVIFENVRAANHGPLRDPDLAHIYERVIDVMRKIQMENIAPAQRRPEGATASELEPTD